MNSLKISKKTYKPLLLLALFVIMVISSTTAYFTSLTESDQNIFTSGDLKIEISQNEVLSLQDWSPGSEHSMEFSVINTGSLSEYVKGYLGGNWSKPELENSVFKIVKLERKVNEVWVVVADNLSIGDEFYLSSDGTEQSLLEILPGNEEDYKFSVKLSEDTTDDYQKEYFSASLHLAAKQVHDGASWPSNY